MSMTDDDGNSILHVSAALGRSDILKLYISPENVDTKNFMGWTPLMQAARFGHFECIKYLLSKSANILNTNRYGVTALSMASAFGDLSIIYYMIVKLPKQCFFQFPTIIAVLFSNADLLRFCLSQYNLQKDQLRIRGLRTIEVIDIIASMEMKQIIKKDSNYLKVRRFSATSATSYRQTSSPLPVIATNLKNQFRLVHILQKHRLAHLLPIFLDQEIDYEIFLTLTRNDFKFLNIPAQFHESLLNAILKQNKS